MPSRRRFLSALGFGLLSLAGCSGTDPTTPDGSPTPTASPPRTPTATETPATRTPTEDPASATEEALGLADLEIDYGLARTADVQVTITREDGDEVVLNETVTMAGSESATFPNPVRRAGNYTIAISTGNLSRSYTWQTPASDAYGVVVYVDEPGIEFSEVVN